MVLALHVKAYFLGQAWMADCKTCTHSHLTCPTGQIAAKVNVLPCCFPALDSNALKKIIRRCWDMPQTLIEVPVQLPLINLSVSYNIGMIDYRRLNLFPCGIGVKKKKFGNISLHNAGANFRPSHKVAKNFENHLNPVMSVFIGQLSLSALRWVPMCQGFSHFQFFFASFCIGQISHQQHN